MSKPTIAVWFSCGAASAVAARATLEKYGETHNVIVANNPVAEEGPDNRRFLRDVENWLGIKIEIVPHPDHLDFSARGIWAERGFMSGPLGAPCTMFLKKKARQIWQEKRDIDFHVLGFTYEERKRHDRFVLTEISNVLPVLIDEKITKQDCASEIIQAGIPLTEQYLTGLPNSNCWGCVKATSPTYWNHLRKVKPSVFEDRAKQSRDIGAKLARVKGRRIYLDQLKITDKGRPLKSIKMPECGIFCEE